MASVQDKYGALLNTIRGKVTLKETGAGIPDLLVVIYDLDPGTKPEDSFPADADAGTPSPSIARMSQPSQPSQPSLPWPFGLQGDRLGSVITAADGTWMLSYYDPEFRTSNPAEKRPDLQLMVLAPEDADSAVPPVVLFNSKVLRANAGRTEGYLIRISSKQLSELGLPIPDEEKSGSAAVKQIALHEAKKKAQMTLRGGLREVNRRLDAVEAAANAELRAQFRKAILPNRDFLNAMPNFVSESKTIAGVQKAVFLTGADAIDEQIDVQEDPSNPQPGKGIRINVMLTDEEKEALAAFKFSVGENDFYAIPEDKIQDILFKRERDDGINTILFSNNPISKYCVQKSTDEKCALKHTGMMPEDEDTHSHHHEGEDDEEDEDGEDEESTDEGEDSDSDTPVPVEGLTELDIPRYLAKVLGGTPMQVPAGTVETDPGKMDYKSQRPTEASVQMNVDRFALQKGPADTTAFYDFHSLQIAFGYVWQQLLDETLVNLGERINTDQETNGRQGLLQKIKDQVAISPAGGVQMVLAASFEAARNSATEVPAEIAAAFDVSFIEYDALSGDNKEKLLQLATDINSQERAALFPPPERMSHSWWDMANFIDTSPKVDPATVANVLRDQGERIIDNIRVNKPYTTNQMLKELQERLLSKYEFTVFAADRNTHSINFGLMNTYRQKWEPISYQAGKLVKTMPLSPKEERKYSVKTTQSEKVTRKQAKKNNDSLHQEINTTNRAESEIIAKAMDKSNFNMSVKLDYSHFSSQVGFSRDAQKDSSQSKKDFRESVIKAVQEFKEERSVEVDTETSDSSEYNESGTIVNPNDELSVTYLFYELQRRYRISEQLYRVLPVVLVAQEVPSPDQISEGWVVAHDWILNRVLLDDSFRPALGALAQRKVGDDYAVRELRKNLRQQRTLVNNLQVEFSRLQRQVDNKYQYLQRKTGDRIDEEHDKRFYKWWWWWGRDNKPDQPPDPEMAKAMEQSAADDHKHAVEQAERLSLSVQREVNALHQLTTDYNEAMRQHLDAITQTRRLITHIKENILYYMQAIWSMEPPDQRFMRLYKVEVPDFEADRTCVIADAPADDLFAQFRTDGKVKHAGWISGRLKRNADGTLETKPPKQLIEVADLDTMLGFKGNYMIFPLKQHNALTELMAAPYVDEAFGAMDPDELSNVSLEEFSKYVCCLYKEDYEKYAELKTVLVGWLDKLLADPLRNGDEVIIPTGSLFLEMLPSDRSLLEDFKLRHREWDVHKVQAEVRKLELENIRYAARILNQERGDPDVEKKIVVRGGGVSTDLDVDSP